MEKLVMSIHAMLAVMNISIHKNSKEEINLTKWKCVVCGYIHNGDEPPERCPICGAPKSKFIKVE
jgi:rubrerythrin